MMVSAPTLCMFGTVKILTNLPQHAKVYVHDTKEVKFPAYWAWPYFDHKPVRIGFFY